MAGARVPVLPCLPSLSLVRSPPQPVWSLYPRDSWVVTSFT